MTAKQETVGVTYIGRREEFVDRNYRTGLTFTKGQTRQLPPHIAKQFLRHTDAFELSTEKPPAKRKASTEDDTQELLDKAKEQQDEANRQESRLQDLRDQVMAMQDKESLDNFAQTNYQQPLDKRSSIETLREVCIGFINQFGAA